MDKKLIVKGIVRLVAEVSVGAVMTKILDRNLPEDMTKTQKVLVGIGTFVLTSVVTTACGDYMVELIEAFDEGFKTIKSNM